MERVTLTSALRFKGATSVDVYNAPDSKQNGDIYVNDSEAVANNTWLGIEGETIAQAQAIGWSETQARWYALGGISDPEVHDSDFVSAKQRYTTLDSNEPAAPFAGELWLDRKADLVKIYDGSVWFEFPMAGGPPLTKNDVVSTVDSAMNAGIISLDASPSGGASDDF